MIDPSSIRDRLRLATGGRYEVEHEIGRGGMAIVYRARDVRYQRHVALKVLTPDLGSVLGAERFLAEIRVTANLQHPHIVPLFDSGEAEGLLYYVMPWVEGESLRARLSRERELPLDEALRIAGDVGSALEHAHQRDVVHRDLKPENILLQDGRPIVADFGIALALSRAGGERITDSGISLGTPQYMAPEQATGERTIDARADVYALAAVLYEMLTGEAPHSGPTAQAVITRIVTETPRDPRSTRPAVPEHVASAIMTALEKRPADRFATVRAFLAALAPPNGRAPAPRAASQATRPWLTHPALVAGLAALIVLPVLVASSRGRQTRGETSSPRAIRFELSAPAGMRVRNSFGSLGAISPDGRQLVYVGEGPAGTQLWLRDLDRLAARPLPGTEDAHTPIFSPDGRWIAFFNSARLLALKMPVGGGPIVPLYPNGGPIGLAWIPGDSIVHARGYLAFGQPLQVIGGDGGPPRPFLGRTEASLAQGTPYLAPDGETLFLVSRRRHGTIFDDELAYATLRDRRLTLLGIKARVVLGYAVGHVIYADVGGEIFAVPFDLERRRITGTSVATGERVRIDQFGPKVSLSAHGDLVYLGGSDTTRVLLVDGAGRIRHPLRNDRAYAFPRFSPDGSRIAFTIDEGGRTDVWIYVVGSRTLERLTTDGRENSRAEWSPDGTRVLYRSNRSGQFAIWWQRADGSGSAEQLTPVTGLAVQEAVVSPDGRYILYRVDEDPGTARNVYVAALVGDRTPRAVLATTFDELTPRFSPNGRWITYVSNESGRQEVYVRPFPGPGGRVLISENGGQEPLWSRDGRHIFYRTPTGIIRASFAAGAALAVARRDTVLRGDYLANRFHPMYDVAPDGSLLVLESADDQVPLTIVLNWTRQLEQRLRANPR